MISEVTDDQRVSFIIGARGWDHDAWAGSYYPDDLPRSWRLSYYSNEFHGVLVPASLWLNYSSDTWSEWKDDVSDNFRFFLELEAAAAGELQRLKQFIDLLGDALGGVVVTKGLLPQALEIAGELSGKCFYPVVAADLQSSFAAVADDFEVRFYGAWAVGQSCSPSIALLDSEGSTADLRRLRHLIESLGADSRIESPSALFFCGEAVDVPRMQDAKTVADLLGCT